MSFATAGKSSSANRVVGYQVGSGASGSPAGSRMTRQNKKNDSAVSCSVDKRLLDSLIQNLQALRGNLNEEDQAQGGVSHDGEEVDPSDLNSVLHHLFRAVNDLTQNIKIVRDQCDNIKKAQATTETELEKRMRANEDEMDECRQRSLKGNFIISSPPDPSKQRVSLLKTDEQLRQDGETLIDHVLDLAKRKYDVTISTDDVQACHRLPNNSVILRIWRRCPGSAWQDLVEKVKSGTNSGFNVYLNFHLTRRRNSLVYEIRKMKKMGKIHKFLTDENGHITVKVRESDGKKRITFFAGGPSEAPKTFTTQELFDLVG